MDPDMVRQQEEAELEARLEALKLQRAAAAPIPFVVEMAAVEAAKPVLAEVLAPAPFAAPVLETIAPAPVAAPVLETAAPAAPIILKKKPLPDRPALPPVSARGPRKPAPDRIRHGLLRGVARFIAYAVAGAMLGLILGNGAVEWLNVAPEQSATVIYSAAGCFAFLCALISILHHER
jgi:hypothetical protein